MKKTPENSMIAEKKELLFFADELKSFQSLIQEELADKNLDKEGKSYLKELSSTAGSLIERIERVEQLNDKEIAKFTFDLSHFLSQIEDFSEDDEEEDDDESESSLDLDDEFFDDEDEFEEEEEEAVKKKNKKEASSKEKPVKRSK